MICHPLIIIISIIFFLLISKYFFKINYCILFWIYNSFLKKKLLKFYYKYLYKKRTLLTNAQYNAEAKYFKTQQLFKLREYLTLCDSDCEQQVDRVINKVKLIDFVENNVDISFPEGQ